MKSILTNPVVRMVRDEVNDLRKKSKDPRTEQSQQQPMSNPPSAPSFYHHPPPSSGYQPSTNPYSHTASSTAGYSQSNTYPTLPTNNDARERQNLLGRIESTATNLVGNLVGQDTVVSATHKLNSVVTNGRNARELLRNGAVVQLGSKNSGRLLQVVMSSSGVLVFDGNGFAGFNTYFTVEDSVNGRIRFHNNQNYLGFEHNQPCVLPLSSGGKFNSNVDFRVHDILGSSNLVAFESCGCKHCFISISTDGHLKTTNNKDKNIDAQFSVIPVVTNIPPPMFYNHPQPPQHAPAFNPNPYGGYMNPQPAMYHQQPPTTANTPPPPPYSVHDPYSQPSAPSGLYPQFH